MRHKKFTGKLRVYFFVLYMLPFYGFCQDVAGVYTGRLYNDTTKQYIPFELAIDNAKGKTEGFSHTIFASENGDNVGVKQVKIKIKNDGITFEDEKFVYNNFPEPPPKGVKMFASLNISTRNGIPVLSGTWRTNATRQYRPLTGTIMLEKKKDPQATPIVKKLEDLGLADNLAFLAATPNTVAADTKAREDSIRKQQELDALAKAQKAREDFIRKQQELETLAKAQKAREDSLRKQQETDALARAQRAREDSIRKQQELDAITKAQKAREDSIRKQQELDALAKAQKAREDSIRKQQELEAVAKAQKAREDSISKQQELDALAKAQKAKEDSLKKQQEELARAERIKLYREQQAKEEQEKQRIAQEQAARAQAAKDQKAREDQARQLAEKDAVAEAQRAKEEAERQKRAQEELLSVQKANPTAGADLSKRKLETIRTVVVAQDSLVFSLYDNGTVDGDTVSVLINGKVAIPRVGLLEKAYNKTIYLTPDMGDSISVVLYAENLGSIPPNTGLLVIREGSKIYEIRFSGDMDKNSKIVLIRKKIN
ncbi:MAG: hypothetical protein ACTHM5_13765 [Ginsengibacter sp.]